MYERVGESVIVVCESDRCILMALKKIRNLFFSSNLRREEQTTVGQPLDNPLDAPRTHKEPRKTKDGMEDDL